MKLNAKLATMTMDDLLGSYWYNSKFNRTVKVLLNNSSKKMSVYRCRSDGKPYALEWVSEFVSVIYLITILISNGFSLREI